MKYFPEIIRILDRFREPRIETIDPVFRSRKEDKAYQLYDGIRNDLFRNDNVAARVLYNASSTDNRYTSLKNRLKGRLLNSLFHLNLKSAGFSESAQAGYTVRKRSFLVHVLLMLGARTAAIRMAERTLDLARRYHHSDITLEMALLIRNHASILGKAAMYENYDALFKKTLRVFEAECTSFEYFDRAQSILNRKIGGRRQYAPQFEEYLAELRSLLNEDSSYSFRLNYYRLFAMFHGVSGEQAERVAACDEAIRYQESLPHLRQSARIGQFALEKLDSFIAGMEYESAQQAAIDCAALIPHGSNNWFAYASSKFLLRMNTFAFVEANELYLETTRHPRFALQPEIAREIWRIYELYLHYALRRTPGYESMEIRKGFDPSRLLSLTPIAARDKHGLNVALLIGHVLFMIDAGDFAGIVERMEALTTYRVRYLRVTDNPKSHLFFKLLRIMENTAFSYDRAFNDGDAYYRELKSLRPEIVHPEEELQILPYSWLWERILEKLREFRDGAKKRSMDSAREPQARATHLDTART